MATPTSCTAEQHGAGYQQVGSNHTLVAGNDNKVYIGAVDHRVNSILEKLSTTNPPDDKHRIEDTTGGLWKECYRWVLTHDDFQSWYSGRESKLLWIRGDPGKGKTMLICGVINYIGQNIKDAGADAMVAFFFCQASDERLNNKTAVLRGLCYMLMKHPQSAPAHNKIIASYGDAGVDVFKGVNGWYALQNVFKILLDHSSPHQKYIIIDGLDECIEGREELLDLVASLAGNNVRVLVSSRNWAEIEECLDENSEKYCLRLELNDTAVRGAISTFISAKVKRLARRKKLNEQTRQAVSEYLQENASNTFLWVALVCQELLKPTTKSRDILTTINRFPPGLDAFYEQETRRIEALHDQACVLKDILGVRALVYRPITLLELSTMVDLPEKDRHEHVSDREETQTIWKENVESCESFLFVRDNTIYFRHQSAFELAKKRFVNSGEPCTTGISHGEVAKRAISALSTTLHQDMYECKRPATTISDALQRNNGFLDSVAYQCVHWADHVIAAVSNQSHPDLIEVDGIVEKFLGKHALNWLEALSLLESAPSAIVRLTNLISAAENAAEDTSLVPDRREAKRIRQTPRDCLLLRDTLRFASYFLDCARDYPIQIYTCAPVFTPTASPLRHRLGLEEKKPRWMKGSSEPTKNWSECLRTLSVMQEMWVVSPSGNSMASCASDGSVAIWDALTGQKMQNFNTPDCRTWPHSMQFSPGEDILAFGVIEEGIAHVFVATLDTGNLQLLETVGADLSCGAKLSFSQDDSCIFFGCQFSPERILRLNQWQTTDSRPKSLGRWGSAAVTLQFSKADTHAKVLGFSHCGTFVVVLTEYATENETKCSIIVWNVVSKLQELRVMLRSRAFTKAKGVSFSPDSSRCVLWEDQDAYVLDIRKGTTTKLKIAMPGTRKGHLSNMVFSPRDDCFAVGLDDGMLCVLRTDGSFGRFLGVPDHNETEALSFSKDGSRLFSESSTGIRIWDWELVRSRDLQKSSDNVVDVVSRIWPMSVVEFDNTQTTILWDGDRNLILGRCTVSGQFFSTTPQVQPISRVRLTSMNNRSTLLIAVRTLDDSIEVWDLSSGMIRCRTEGSPDLDHTTRPIRAELSADGEKMATATIFGSVAVWDISGDQASLLRQVFSGISEEGSDNLADQTSLVKQSFSRFSESVLRRIYFCDASLAFDKRGSLAFLASNGSIKAWQRHQWDIREPTALRLDYSEALKSSTEVWQEHRWDHEKLPFHRSSNSNSDWYESLKWLSNEKLLGRTATCVSFSPSGEKIAAGFYMPREDLVEYVLCIWNASTGASEKMSSSPKLPIIIPWDSGVRETSQGDGLVILRWAPGHYDHDGLPEPAPRDCVEIATIQSPREADMRIDELDSREWIYLQNEPVLWLPPDWSNAHEKRQTASVIALQREGGFALPISLSEEYLSGEVDF